MSEVLLYAAVGVAGIWIVCVWLRGWLFTSCILCTTTLIYAAGYAQTQAPVRVALLSFLVLGVVALFCENTLNVSRRAKFICIGCVAVCGVIFVTGQVLLDGSASDPLFRYTLLYPLAALAGFLISGSDKQITVARTYVSVSLLMGLLAIFERLTANFLVAGTYENADRLVRDGSIRSIVFAEHPLVLSVLLVCAMPFVSQALPWHWLRFAAYVVIVASVLSTNSRGALVLLATWALLRITVRFSALRTGFTRVLKVTVGLGAAVAFYALLLGSGSEQLESSTAVDASAEYRSTLYSFAVRSLFEQPFGWGISGLPEGTYLAASLFGPLDVAKTVDSELALTVFDFGWIGLVTFLALGFGLVQPQRLASTYGQAAFLVTASGLYLALHAWVGLGTLWWLLIGLTFGAQHTKSPSGRLVQIHSKKLQTRSL
ncbi:hypothetical protein StoSoilB5_38330 [Arthrobacter sp. StoSoilB5]|nr:hypothetical protein StoSoilB5_38330 [Arthrobacter sp. StoSoilB5]